MTEPLFSTALEAAAALRRRELSSRELTELLLARIDAVDPQLHAITELRREAALEEAEAADRALAAGSSALALLGVPITIKESFNVAGLHTTWGNPAFRDNVPDWDATIVRRLRDAGAVIVGKSNVHFMLADFGHSSNELYGATTNPWDISRTPGGSSGGAAAALAAGMTFLEYGSDLAGSVRVPANFCGVYGLRPTPGTTPLTGFQPTGPPQPQSELGFMVALGPLARSAADLRCALQLTAGPEPPAARAYRWALAPPRRQRLDGFRVGVVLDHEFAPVAGAVGSVLAGALEAIAGSGAKVIEGWPPDVDPIAQYEAFGFQVRLFLASQQPDPSAGSLAELAEQERRRLAARASWQAYFDEVDVFVCPVNLTAAFAHDERPFAEREVGGVPYDRQPFWTAHAAIAGLPAATAPIGRTSEGLPVGLQILAPPHADDTAITFAELLAEIVGGYEIPPL